MGPAVVGRGTQKALEVYEKLLAELEERVDFAERLLTKHRDQSVLPGGQ